MQNQNIKNSLENLPQNKFLPTTKDEMNARGWDELDVVLITGDAYIDSPFMGIAVVGRILESVGLRVGIIGQPDISSDVDIKDLVNQNYFGELVVEVLILWFQIILQQKSLETMMTTLQVEKIISDQIGQL